MKGFVISWFYPPGNSSEGLVTYKLLSNSKYKYDVWTKKTREKNIWDRPVRETDLVSNNVNIIQNGSDSKKEWQQEAIKYFSEHQDEYDFIMSRILPEEAHEIALKIKALFPQKKWIASFGDPIVDSPYITCKKKANNPFLLKEYIIKEKPSLPRTIKIFISPVRFAKKYIWNKKREEAQKVVKRFKKLNTEVFEKADIILLNNDFQFKRAFSPKQYSGFQHKGAVIYHSFDRRLYPVVSKQKKSSKKIVFSYVGHLDEIRNAKALFKAINKLKQEDTSLSKKVEFNFFGHIGSKDREYIFSHDIDDVVKIHSDIGYKESLKKASEADWNLLIDANFNKELDEYIYFPAKLADYLGAGKNIFAISQLKGTTASIIAKTKGGKVVSHSAEDIFLYLSKIIYQGYKPDGFDKKEVAEYNAVNVAKKFDKLVKEMLDEKD